jgi:Low-density lipoprotein receptor repeat class B
MYWINWNLRRPTIESSLMNGSERQVIIEEELRTPRGLALDIRKQKMYWANNLHFSTFRIERSNVDGTERELVHSGKGQFVFSLAVILWHNLIHESCD